MADEASERGDPPSEEAAAAAAAAASAATTGAVAVAVDDDDDGKKGKRVRFSEDSRRPSAAASAVAAAAAAAARSSITPGDAIHAYGLLMRASSIVARDSSSSSSSSSSFSSSPPTGDDENGGRRGGGIAINVDDVVGASAASWEDLNVAADVHRALLVASCLLLELLLPTTSGPSDIDDDDDDDDDDDNPDDYNSDDARWERPVREESAKKRGALPRDDFVDDDNAPPSSSPCVVPALSPAIEGEILSACRLCIRRLRALERVCAVKAIAARRRRAPDAASSPSSFLRGGGGDDVHDYDRPSADAARDYDWHDDGFLPPPLSCYHADEGTRQSSSWEGSPSPTYDILRDCFHRPQRPTDPPSSKFERSAWTRDWIRNERVVSLDLEDYRCREHEVVDDYDVGDYERLCAEEEACRCETMADDDDDDDDDDERSDDDEGAGENNDVSLNISSAELAEEEGFLLDVMLAGGGGAVSSASRSVHPSSSGYYSGCHYDPNASSAPFGGKRVGSVKETRKKKRQRKLAARRARLAGDDAARIDRTPPRPPKRSFFTAREGFLLLLHEEDSMSNGGLEIIRRLSDDAAASARDQKVEAVRVYARLHPSGWLSVEDRSIRRRGDFSGDRDEDHDKHESTNEQQRQRLRQLTRPLSPRARYLDFYIDPGTTCSPWVREGMTSFHFRLHDVLFLGASSLNNRSFDIGSVDDKNNNAANDVATSSIAERAHLLFGIDEGTGGDFADGFEWVNCMTGVEFPANNSSSVMGMPPSEPAIRAGTLSSRTTW